MSPRQRRCPSRKLLAPSTPGALVATQRRKTHPSSRDALKTKYLACLRARSPLTLRQTVRSLTRAGVRRDLLLAWAVAAGHDRKYIAKVLSECLTALGLRQRRPGAGRRTAPPGLVLLAFARELFAGRERKSLRAAWRAAQGPVAARLQTQGLAIIPEPELYTDAVEHFSRALSETANHRKAHEKTA